MAHNVIVVISDLDNAVRAEVNVLGSSEEAAQLVESLIESGFEQERIRVFQGDEMQMEVRHRPVVSLSSETNGRTTKEDAPEAETKPAAPPQKEPAPSGAAVNAASLVIDAAAEPFTKNGQRFSSMFSPDTVSA
jgi:hypothetical protein